MKQVGETILYDVSDLSNLLNLKVPTINKMCREKEIKAKKVGRGWQVTEENLNMFLKGGKNKWKKLRILLQMLLLLY